MEFLARFVNPIRRAWVLIFIVVPLLLCSLAAMCLLETWYLGYLLDAFAYPAKFALLLFSAVVLLLLVNLILAVLCLQLTEAARAAGLAETMVLLILAVSYAVIPKQQLIQPLLFLATGKILSTILFARFWHAKFRVFRMRYKESPSARFFLMDLSRFLSCVWVLLGTWFISILAFALALVVSQTFLELQGWEGLGILLTFFALFWIFVRNPHAHAEV
ncbi:MAG: hypothetical protein FJY29_11405 [Betaproteobacteria bacterium]|nr:hypothetical protein [Betaproteobacteria bacterium]